MSGDTNGEQKAEKRRYNYMENVLQHVITKISVNEEDKKRNNKILNAAIETLIGNMRNTSSLFSKLYQRHFYGGSYYDNLKTGNPDEYDIDLILVLPKKAIFKLEPTNEAPGFVNLQYTPDSNSKNDFKEISNLFDNNNLCANKLLKWMEGVITKTMQELPKSGTQSVINILGTDFFIKIRKSGPAFTARLNGLMCDTDMHFDVDLVPCFIFSANMWPNGNFRSNPVKEIKGDFLIVPKLPKSTALPCQTSYCWRLSFQEQERLLIRGSRTLKPCIKLMKKLRDHLQQTSISSYFIKTIFMWEVEKQEKGFWENSLSYVFVEMLQVYEKCLREHTVPYYWNTQNNLIENLGQVMVANYANRIKRIIDNINTKPNEQCYIATLFLNEAEIEHLKVELLANNKKSEDNNIVSIKSKCNCRSSIDLNNALSEMHKEIEEARQEQENLKIEILEVLRVVVKRLDDIDTKLH